ncbi:MAG TPA: DUF4352 domain-containing protein [Chloroflexi bacterium]|nr:DUF4352 domain-containing protein [Chloroflexota bacterium]
MKTKLSILFVVMVLAAATLACSSSSDTPEKVGEATPIGAVQAGAVEEENEPPATEPTATKPKLQVYGIGDIVQIGDLTLVVNGILYPEAKEYFEPETGNRFVAVDVTFENLGDESEHLSSMLQMTLKDETGQDYSVDISANMATGSKIPEGEIVPGEKLRGVIGYQVPESAKGFQFVFDASLFGSGKVFVDLGE